MYVHIYIYMYNIQNTEWVNVVKYLHLQFVFPKQTQHLNRKKVYIVNW